MGKRGVLLVNLGSPDSTSVADVRRYLNQFLMDKYVIDLPWPLRRLIVSAFVLPKRPAQSAKAYQSIWWQDGSPLKVISERLTNAVKERVDIPVELAMRYGNPSIESAIRKLLDHSPLDEIMLVPLYPHYAMSTVKTVAEEVERVLAELSQNLKLTTLPVFYDHPEYIEALVQSAQPYLSQDYDHILFSYHGVPERHIRKDDPTKSHCLATGECCQRDSVAHKTCYRHQVFSTTEAFVAKAGIEPGKYSVSFQSRLGRAKWLEPATDATIKQLAQQGVKKLLVICPAFVADCLETLEEIGMEGRELFLQGGGEEYALIPCLNDQPDWADVLAGWISK